VTARKYKQYKGQSDFTSIQARIVNKQTSLLGFGQETDSIPYSLADYLALVDYTGRAVLEIYTSRIRAHLAAPKLG